MFKKLFGFHDIEVKGQMKVETLQSNFEKSFGTKIRIYRTTANGQINTGKGARLADPKATLASICANGAKVSDITIKKSYTVEFIENEFSTKMGIGVQIMTPDGLSFAPNGMRLKDVASIPSK